MHANQVQLHLIHFPEALAQLARCVETLSDDEITRMHRFYSAALQQNFALTRGALRLILAAQLHIPAAEITFEYTEQGKPFLPKQALQFNLAHSGDYCIIALCLNDRIGVDIERCSHPHKAYYDIAKRFFTPAEYRALSHCPLKDGETLFYHIWTQKEAFLKAIGQGIAFGLDHFEVATDFKQSWVKHIQDPLYAEVTWDSRAFQQPEGYRVVVTKENPIQEINWAPTHSVV